MVGAAKAPTVAECWDGTQRFFRVHRVDRPSKGRYLGPGGMRFSIADFFQHRLPILVAGLKSRARKRQAEKRGARIASLNEEFTYFTTRTFDFRSSDPAR